MTPLFMWLLTLPLLGSTSDDPSYCQLARRITSQHIMEMKSRGFSVNMTGGGFMYNVEEIAVGFEKEISPSLMEARILYVKAVQDLLERVNNDPEIRPCLSNYPFDVRNLAYNMAFGRIPVSRPGREPIAFICCVKNTIDYSVYDPNDGNGNPFRTVHRESFDDAKRIVDESDRKTGP